MDHIHAWNAQLEVLTPRLRVALEDTFRGLVGDTPQGDMAGLAVLCDPDGDSLTAAAETFDGLDEKETTRADIRRDFRWSPQEWSRTDAEVFKDPPLSTLMQEVQQSVPHTEGDHYDWVFLLMEWVVDALAGMLEEGWFDEFDTGSVLVVDVAGMDVVAETRIEWMSMVNESENLDDYRRWLSGDRSI